MPCKIHDSNRYFKICLGKINDIETYDIRPTKRIFDIQTFVLKSNGPKHVQLYIDLFGSVNFSLVGIYTNLIPKSFFSFFTIFMYKTKVYVIITSFKHQNKTVT